MGAVQQKRVQMSAVFSGKKRCREINRRVNPTVDNSKDK